MTVRVKQDLGVQHPDAFLPWPYRAGRPPDFICNKTFITESQHVHWNLLKCRPGAQDRALFPAIITTVS
jgi:hypothetical protein